MLNYVGIQHRELQSLRELIAFRADFSNILTEKEMHVLGLMFEALQPAYLFGQNSPLINFDYLGLNSECCENGAGGGAGDSGTGSDMGLDEFKDWVKDNLIDIVIDTSGTWKQPLKHLKGVSGTVIGLAEANRACSAWECNPRDPDLCLDCCLAIMSLGGSGTTLQAGITCGAACY